jgi:hypothetical protein
MGSRLRIWSSRRSPGQGETPDQRCCTQGDRRGGGWPEPQYRARLIGAINTLQPRRSAAAETSEHLQRRCRSRRTAAARTKRRRSAAARNPMAEAARRRWAAIDAEGCAYSKENSDASLRRSVFRRPCQRARLSTGAVLRRVSLVVILRPYPYAWPDANRFRGGRLT